ncbi:hypothetical protein [Rhodococcus sp. NPDC058514]|uniref:hypothetical protein n=1 Tax=unclassified Rhodococcus (in: high G+C Gram-positive bacteria) TaxID=192944 RepID=UPI003647E414
MSERMMRIVELALAVLAVGAAVWCWNRGVQTSDFGPAMEGAPEFTGTHYSGTWIGAATLLVIVAGLLVIDAVRRRVRGGPQ